MLQLALKFFYKINSRPQIFLSILATMVGVVVPLYIALYIPIDLSLSTIERIKNNNPVPLRIQEESKKTELLQVSPHTPPDPTQPPEGDVIKEPVTPLPSNPAPSPPAPPSNHHEQSNLPQISLYTPPTTAQPAEKPNIFIQHFGNEDSTIFAQSLTRHLEIIGINVSHSKNSGTIIVAIPNITVTVHEDTSPPRVVRSATAEANIFIRNAQDGALLLEQFFSITSKPTISPSPSVTAAAARLQLAAKISDFLDHNRQKLNLLR